MDPLIYFSFQCYWGQFQISSPWGTPSFREIIKISPHISQFWASVLQKVQNIAYECPFLIETSSLCHFERFHDIDEINYFSFIGIHVIYATSNLMRRLLFIDIFNYPLVPAMVLLLINFSWLESFSRSYQWHCRHRRRSRWSK